MQKENKSELFYAGKVEQEKAEIKKIQNKADSILTMLTNTCTGVYTIFCC